MKKTLTIFLMLITTVQVHSCCQMGWQGFVSAHGVGLGGYWELSPKYYPKTVAFFDELKIKYQALKPINILILTGPMADADTIYFPMSWIEELEKGNKFYKQATEWIILHELGHIVNCDINKRGIAYLTILGGYFGLLGLAKQDEAIRKKYQTISLAAIAAGIIGQCYSMGTAEYYADDYAMSVCDNPEAWLAAYEFLDRKAPLGWLPGILHSFTGYRLSRIAKAFKAKFGYELMIVPQSLDPIYEA